MRCGPGSASPENPERQPPYMRIYAGKQVAKIRAYSALKSFSPSLS